MSDFGTDSESLGETPRIVVGRAKNPKSAHLCILRHAEINVYSLERTMQIPFTYSFGLLSRLLIFNIQGLKNLYIALRDSEQQVFFCRA